MKIDIDLFHILILCGVSALFYDLRNNPSRELEYYLWIGVVIFIVIIPKLFGPPKRN